MTNTIPNVPRELLADLLGNDHDKRIMAERHLLAMLANAPSPAGVDGLDVVATAILGGVEYGIGGPELGEIDVELSMGTLCRIQEQMVSNEDSVYLDLCSLSDAKAIIDGLRGEVARLSSQKADWVDRATALGQQADQQAETIANYKSQFSELHAARNLLSRLSMAGFELGDDAATSVIDERDQQAQRIGELEGFIQALLLAGNPLSNSAYNLAQHEGHAITKYECELLSSLRKQWDAALSAGKEGE